MRKCDFDLNGDYWEVFWGIYDAQLEDELNKLNYQGELIYTGNQTIFTDPLHINEKKQLAIYKDDEGNLFLIGEITPCIYAIGTKINR